MTPAATRNDAYVGHETGGWLRTLRVDPEAPAADTYERKRDHHEP